jgi:hypothetical protein
MGILIPLKWAEVECLLSHLPVGSDLRQKLTNSHMAGSSNVRAIGFSNTLQCTVDEAHELLRIAEEHCYPDAIREIQRSMNLCGL